MNRKHIRRQFSFTLLSYIPFFRKYPAEINKYIERKEEKKECKVGVVRGWGGGGVVLECEGGGRDRKRTRGGAKGISKYTVKDEDL